MVLLMFLGLILYLLILSFLEASSVFDFLFKKENTGNK